MLISVLKPHRLYKKLLVKILEIRIQIGSYKYKLHHFLLFIAGFYGTLYFFIQMQGKQFYPNKLDPYRIKMEKLDKKWVIEAQSWLAFLNVICLISIYRNSKLFNIENALEKQIKELKGESDQNSKKKNE